MPFVTADEPQRIDTLRPAVQPPAPDLFAETIPAAFRAQNIVASALARRIGPQAPAVPGFDPFDHIEGYEDYARQFLNADSPDDVARIRSQIDRELRDRDTLAAAGTAGVLAQIAAGILDPVNLVPVGGAAAAGGRLGYNLLRGAATGALAVGAQEVGLHATQRTRTREETAIGIAAGGFLGGLLGAAAGRVAPAERATLAARIDREMEVPPASAPDLVAEPGAIRITPEELDADIAAAPITPEPARSPQSGPDRNGYPGEGDSADRTPASPDGPENTSASGTSPRQDRPPPVVEESGTLYEALYRADRATIEAKPPVPVVEARSRWSGLAWRDLRTATKQWARGFFAGPAAFLRNRDTGWTEIRVSRQGIEKTSSGADRPQHFEVLPHLPALMENAVLIESNRGLGDSANVRAFHRLYAPLRLDGELYRVKLTVKETTEGRLFYEHVLTEIEGPAVLSGAEAPSPAGSAPRPAGPSALNVGDLLAGVKFRGGDDVLDGRPIGEAPAAPVRPVEAGEVAGADAAGDGIGRSAGAAWTGGTSERRLKGALGMEKALAFSSPILRTATSPSVETRRLAQQLAETPFYYEDNALGIATPEAVERRVRRWQANLARGYEAVRSAYLDYRRQFGAARTNQGAGPRGGRPLSFREFREEVGRTMRRGDQAPDPFVTRAAQSLRREVFEPLKARAIEVGLLPEDVTTTTAASYLTRVYDRERIVARRPEFVGIVADWLAGLRGVAEHRLAEADAQVSELGPRVQDLADQVETAKAERQATARELREARRQHLAAERDAMAARREARQADTIARRMAEREDRFEPVPDLDRADPLAAFIRDLRRGGPVEKPLRLAEWLRRNGGLRDEGGELRALGIEPKARPGLINNRTGRPLDDAVHAAWEAGYFAADEAPDVRTFLYALGDDVNGTSPAYRDADLDLVARAETAREFARDLEARGIDMDRLTDAELARVIETGDADLSGLVRSTPATRARVREIGIHRRAAERRAARSAERRAATEAAQAEARARLEQLRLDVATASARAANLEGELRRLRSQLDRARRRQESEAGLARAEDVELRETAEQVTDKIMGAPAGRILYEAVPFTRGPLRERTLDIPDELIEGFLVSDVDHVANLYVRSMAPDVELFGEFGSLGLDDRLDLIGRDFKRKIAAAATEDERRKLHARWRADIRDVTAMLGRLRNTWGIPDNPDTLGVRILRGARNVNYLRLLGEQTISALPDLGRPVMIHGISRVLRDGLVPLVRNLRAVKLARREAQLAGTALDMVLESRAIDFAEIGDQYGRHTMFERGLNALTRNFGTITLMRPWTDALKTFTAVVTQTRMIEAARALADGRLRPGLRGRIERDSLVRGQDLEWLAMLGIDRDLAGRIADEFDRHGEVVDGAYLANTERWTDREAIERFRSALAKDVDAAIVTPGIGERPLWLDGSEIGKTIGQFKTFLFVSAQRVLLAGLQQRDAATLSGLLLMVSLGMGAYAMKSMTADRELSEDPARWVAEGIDRSGVLGWFFEVNNIAERLTGGRVGVSAMMDDGRTMSRHAWRGMVSALAGPSAGIFEDVGRTTTAIANGEWGAADVRAARRLFPYQNLVGLREILNEAEAGIARTLGVE